MQKCLEIIKHIKTKGKIWDKLKGRPSLGPRPISQTNTKLKSITNRQGPT